MMTSIPCPFDEECNVTFLGKEDDRLRLEMAKHFKHHNNTILHIPDFEA